MVVLPTAPDNYFLQGTTCNYHFQQRLHRLKLGERQKHIFLWYKHIFLGYSRIMVITAEIHHDPEQIRLIVLW